MRYPLLAALLLSASPAPADEPIFEPGAKLKVEAAGGVGGEGPAWDPQLGLLCSGNGHVNRFSRDGKKLATATRSPACPRRPSVGHPIGLTHRNASEHRITMRLVKTRTAPSCRQKAR